MAVYPAKPTLGYASRTEAVAALLQEGLDYKRIAARLGISEGAASGLCSHVRKRQRRVTYLLPKGAGGGLLRAAMRRGISQNELAERLIAAVDADPDLIDVVLLDGGDE